MSAQNLTSVNPQPAAPSAPVPPVQKQRINVYTMMLVVSFFALVTACILLWLELSSYNEGKYPYWDTSSARTASVQPSAAPQLLLARRS